MATKKKKNKKMEENLIENESLFTEQVEEVKEETEQVEEVKEETEQVEEVKEETEQVEEVEPVNPKKEIMLEFIQFYNAELRGKMRVEYSVGKKVVDFFNSYTGHKVSYTGCGSCIGNKIKFMLKTAKKEWNIEV